MQPIIYDVAVSVDGYISGPAGDISLFAHDGPVVADYQSRMAQYSTAIMGRNTYTFGYAFGLEPGQNPYQQMRTVVFSGSIDLPGNSAVEVCREFDRDAVLRIKSDAAGPVYLCGGGQFAGWLLQEGLIDRVILKRAPAVLGGGVPLFGATGYSSALRRVATKSYDNGYLLEEYLTA